MLDALLQGARYPLRGLGWLTRPGLRRYVLVPLAVNALLFGGATWWGAGQLQGLIQWLDARLPDWLAWLSWLLWPLFLVAVLLVGFYTFTLVANLLAAPFNGLLAEKVEDMLTPDHGRPDSRPLWQEIVIAPAAELRKLGYFLARALPLLLLFLIPGVNAAAPFVWLAFSAWLLALQYLDYPLGNHHIAFPEQRRLLRQRRLLAVGFGAGCLLLTLVPVLNFLAMPASVIGATLLWREQLANSGMQ
ncbi:MAG TPA: sulfate transporter CysZ [Candidatus Competibacteraceae bacterium]|nr:sulfate transporter CysZ [Candidatus Competibacteraceae bacterium]